MVMVRLLFFNEWDLAYRCMYGQYRDNQNFWERLVT